MTALLAVLCVVLAVICAWLWRRLVADNKEFTLLMRRERHELRALQDESLALRLALRAAQETTHGPETVR